MSSPGVTLAQSMVSFEVTTRGCRPRYSETISVLWSVSDGGDLKRGEAWRVSKRSVDERRR